LSGTVSLSLSTTLSLLSSFPSSSTADSTGRASVPMRAALDRRSAQSRTTTTTQISSSSPTTPSVTAVRTGEPSINEKSVMGVSSVAFSDDPSTRHVKLATGAGAQSGEKHAVVRSMVRPQRPPQVTSAASEPLSNQASSAKYRLKASRCAHRLSLTVSSARHECVCPEAALSASARAESLSDWMYFTCITTRPSL
jgi:hypothetical protein